MTFSSVRKFTGVGLLYVEGVRALKRGAKVVRSAKSAVRSAKLVGKFGKFGKFDGLKGLMV